MPDIGVVEVHPVLWQGQRVWGRCSLLWSPKGTAGVSIWAASDDHLAASQVPRPDAPDAPLPVNPRDFKTPNYGMTTFADLFTNRQLTALTTFSDLVGEAL